MKTPPTALLLMYSGEFAHPFLVPWVRKEVMGPDRLVGVWSWVKSRIMVAMERGEPLSNPWSCGKTNRFLDPLAHAQSSEEKHSESAPPTRICAEIIHEMISGRTEDPRLSFTEIVMHPEMKWLDVCIKPYSTVP